MGVQEWTVKEVNKYLQPRFLMRKANTTHLRHITLPNAVSVKDPTTLPNDMSFDTWSASSYV
jgi:hypothetical protein